MENNKVTRQLENQNESQKEKREEKIERRKRKLSDIIDRNQYVISRGTKREYEKKLIVYGDGIIKMNSTFAQATTERTFVVAFTRDFEKVLCISECEEEICFTKNGIARDRDVAKSISGRGLPMPLTYIMSWDSERRLWNGRIDRKSAP